MYSTFQLAYKYLGYLWRGANGKGHGVHSPFVYDFITLVLNDTGNYYCYDRMESLRARLLEDNTELEIADLGAGSRKGTTHRRRVGDIARNALKPPKYSRLLFRIANHYECRQILELGTSLGITTGYLAHAHHAARVVTLEGVPAIADVAAAGFQQHGLHPITLVRGNFDDTLPQALALLPAIDLAYLDGNHRLEPTLRYYRQLKPHLQDHSMVVLDDIHWSAEMEAAWEQVKQDEAVTLSIDLFFIGILFYRKAFKVKQHFTIRF